MLVTSVQAFALRFFFAGSVIKATVALPAGSSSSSSSIYHPDHHHGRGGGGTSDSTAKRIRSFLQSIDQENLGSHGEQAHQYNYPRHSHLPVYTIPDTRVSHTAHHNQDQSDESPFGAQFGTLPLTAQSGLQFRSDPQHVSSRHHNHGLNPFHPYQQSVQSQLGNTSSEDEREKQYGHEESITGKMMIDQQNQPLEEENHPALLNFPYSARVLKQTYINRLKWRNNMKRTNQSFKDELHTLDAQPVEGSCSSSSPSTIQQESSTSGNENRRRFRLMVLGDLAEEVGLTQRALKNIMQGTPADEPDGKTRVFIDQDLEWARLKRIPGLENVPRPHQTRPRSRRSMAVSPYQVFAGASYYARGAAPAYEQYQTVSQLAGHHPFAPPFPEETAMMKTRQLLPWQEGPIFQGDSISSSPEEQQWSSQDLNFDFLRLGPPSVESDSE